MGCVHADGGSPNAVCPRCSDTDDRGDFGAAQMRKEKQVDPGNEFSAPKPGGLTWLISLIRKQPDLNLKTGEGKMLLDEIDRLTAELTSVSDKYRHYLECWSASSGEEPGR